MRAVRRTAGTAPRTPTTAAAWAVAGAAGPSSRGPVYEPGACRATSASSSPPGFFSSISGLDSNSLPSVATASLVGNKDARAPVDALDDRALCRQCLNDGIARSSSTKVRQRTAASQNKGDARDGVGGNRLLTDKTLIAMSASRRRAPAARAAVAPGVRGARQANQLRRHQRCRLERKHRAGGEGARRQPMSRGRPTRAAVRLRGTEGGGEPGVAGARSGKASDHRFLVEDFRPELPWWTLYGRKAPAFSRGASNYAAAAPAA